MPIRVVSGRNYPLTTRIGTNENTKYLILIVSAFKGAKRRKMKNLYKFICSLLICIALNSACSNQSNENAVKNQSNAPVVNQTQVSATQTPTPFTNKPIKKDELSMAKFDQLKNGMTYEQSVEIIGGEGAEVESAESGKSKVIKYKWDDEKSSIILTFENEKLISKKQENLK